MLSVIRSLPVLEDPSHPLQHEEFCELCEGALSTCFCSVVLWKSIFFFSYAEVLNFFEKLTSPARDHTTERAINLL